MQFTHKELLDVPCIHCNANVGSPCVAPGNRRTPILGFHKERSELRVKVPMCEMGQLDSSEKSLVLGYAFLMLCDSCEMHSVKLFGKEFSAREIQRYFAARAVEELKKDGLIGKVALKKDGIVIATSSDAYCETHSLPLIDGKCPECKLQ